MKQEPKFHKEINLKSVLDIVMTVLFFILSKDLYSSVPLIAYIILMGLIIVFFFVGVFSLYGEVYEAECPYCNKTIQIDKDAQGLDCPICNERIIIEEYVPKKVNQN